MNFRRRLSSAALAAVCILGAAAGPAAAQTAPTTTVPGATTTTVPGATISETPTDAAGGVRTMEELSGRYGSLSAALIGYYAGSADTTVADFLALNAPDIAAMLGNTDAARDIVPRLSDGEPDADMLTRSMDEAGLAIDTRDVTDLDDLAAQVTAKSATVDAQVMSAGIGYANQLGSLRAPQLAAAGQLNMDLANGVPYESLAFGLFLDKSLTALVTDSPDVFAQVQSSGLGTAGGQDAWRTAMTNASAASRTDFTKLTNPCMAGMMQVMFTGQASAANQVTGGRNCGSCVTGGLYLNQSMAGLFEQGSLLTQNGDGLMPTSEFGNLQGWLAESTKNQNPALADALADTSGNTDAAACATSSKATSSTLASSLPGMFANLGK